LVISVFVYLRLMMILLNYYWHHNTSYMQLISSKVRVRIILSLSFRWNRAKQHKQRNEKMFNGEELYKEYICRMKERGAEGLQG